MRCSFGIPRRSLNFRASTFSYATRSSPAFRSTYARTISTSAFERYFLAPAPPVSLGGLSCLRSRVVVDQGNFDASVLFASVGAVVRSNRRIVGATGCNQPLRRDADILQIAH